MTDALDKGYNEGRSWPFAREIWSECEAERSEAAAANPVRGILRGRVLNGFESELRRHGAFTPSTGGFRYIEERFRLR